MKLRYTLRGAAELDKVLVTIEERSPQGARHVKARIQAIINLLLQYPHAGQPTSKGRLRRVVAFPLSLPDFLSRDQGRACYSWGAPQRPSPIILVGVTDELLWLSRVSTGGQSLYAQVKQLRDAGAEKVSRETASGARAVANGVRLGRKPTLTYDQQQEAIKRLKAGKETQGQIARSYNVNRWTTARLS